MAFQRDPMSTTGLQRSTNVIGVFQHNKGAPLTGVSLPSGAGGMGVQPPGRPQAPAMRAQPRPPAVSPLAVKRAFSISDYMPTRQQLADAAGSRYALGALAYNQYRLARKKRKGQPDDVGEFIPQALETVSGIDVPEGKPKEWWQAGLLGGGAGLALALKPNIEKVLYKGASMSRIVKKAEPGSPGSFANLVHGGNLASSQGNIARLGGFGSPAVMSLIDQIRGGQPARDVALGAQTPVPGHMARPTTPSSAGLSNLVHGGNRNAMPSQLSGMGGLGSPTVRSLVNPVSGGQPARDATFGAQTPPAGYMGKPPSPTPRTVKKAEPYSEMPAAMRAGALAYGSWRKQQEQKSAQVFMPGNGPVTSQAPTKSTVKASPSVPQPMSSTQRGAVSPASTFALGQRLGSAKYCHRQRHNQLRRYLATTL